MSPEQEEPVLGALVALGDLDTEQGLHAEGVRAIQETLQCSVDEARAVLRELRVRGRIEETTAPPEHVAQPARAPVFRWVRPPAL